MKYHIEKNTVQETLVIPLYGRKMCSELYPNLYRNETALRLIDQIDYDFSLLSQKSKSLMQQFGFLEAAMRQNDLAWEVRDYLRAHPRAAVVNLGPGMGAEILPHLKGQVALPHGDLQGAEGLEQAAGSLLQGGKIIVDLLQQLRCRLVGKQLGELSGTQRPAVQRNHQCLLDGILFNGMPLHISPHFLPTSRAEPDRNRVFPSQGVIKLPSAVGSSCAS